VRDILWHAFHDLEEISNICENVSELNRFTLISTQTVSFQPKK